MKLKYEWVSGEEYYERIKNFLYSIDEIMIPRISDRVSIDEYAMKLAVNAETIFIVDSLASRDIASCSIYTNREEAFISSIATHVKGLGSMLLMLIKKHINNKCIALQVSKKNCSAIKFYEKNDFFLVSKDDEWFSMRWFRYGKDIN